MAVFRFWKAQKKRPKALFQIFTAAGGRYARFFVGATTGWFAGARVVPSVEQIAEHIDEIRDLEEYHVFGSIGDELQLLAEMLG